MNVKLPILLIFWCLFFRDHCDALVMDYHQTDVETVYNLIIEDDGENRTIWSTTIPKIDGKEPYNWRRLIAWERNDAGLLVLLERNPIGVELLRFDRKGLLTDDLKLSDPGWLKSIRYGGTISVRAPDKIIVKDRQGVSEEFVFDGNKVFDEKGVSVEERMMRIEIGGKVDQRETRKPNPGGISFDTSEKKEVLTSGDAVNTRKSERSNVVFLLIGALSFVIVGMLWIILRKR